MYFIDDMNMPFVDKYDTQSAIELVRQMVDYRGWCVVLLLRRRRCARVLAPLPLSRASTQGRNSNQPAAVCVPAPRRTNHPPPTNI